MSDILVRGKFAAPPDERSVAADWRARGFTCAIFVDPPGRRWENFVHDCNEVVTVVDGRLEMEIAGATMLVDPGDEVFVPRGARHSVRNVHDGTSVWLYGYD